LTIDPLPFSLQPFSNDVPAIDIQIFGKVSRQKNVLQIDYQLTGNLTGIVVPPSTETPTRRNELWQTTCFEFFLGIAEDDRYWEFNLSPSGDWNIYRFDGYRQGMKEETAFAILPFSSQIQPNLYGLSLKIDLAAIIAPKTPLDIAITAVIEDKNAIISYWALSHRSSEADFHQRDSFTIAIH
jgi:hypothetical protein